MAINLKEILWSELQTSNDAKYAVQRGAGVALFMAILQMILVTLTVIHVIDNVFDFDYWGYIDPILLAIFSIMMFRMSRTGTVLALVFYTADQIWQQVGENLHPSSPVLTILVALVLLNAARGAFAYRRLAELGRLPSEMAHGRAGP